MKTNLPLVVAVVVLATLSTGRGQTDITITTQPANQTNCVGSTATLTVEATGTEPLAYQWQQAFDLYSFLERPDATNGILVITESFPWSSSNQEPNWISSASAKSPSRFPAPSF